MIRKLLICPYFGPLPDWMPAYWRNVAQQFDDSYTWLVDTDEAGFRRRVRNELGLEAPPMSGSGKSWDYRPALGHLYGDELRGYDFWGHVDFDVVWGRVGEWVTDEFLGRVDMHSNHPTYVCGPWSVYRNVPLLNEAFMSVPGWDDTLREPRATGWAERDFSELLALMHESGEIVKEWTYWQPRNLDDFSACRWDDGRLMCGQEEVFQVHFRRTKVYPPQLVVS